MPEKKKDNVKAMKELGLAKGIGKGAGDGGAGLGKAVRGAAGAVALGPLGLGVSGPALEAAKSAMKNLKEKSPGMMDEAKAAMKSGIASAAPSHSGELGGLGKKVGPGMYSKMERVPKKKK